MKKLNNKGFGHIEIFIVAAVVIVTALIGGFVWQNSKSKDSSAESPVQKNWTVQTVYCSYTECYLNNNYNHTTIKVTRKRWVNAVGIGYYRCPQTGIEWKMYPAPKPANNQYGRCLLRW